MPIVTSIGVNRSNDTFYPIRIDRSEFPWGLYEERFPTMILIDDYVSTDRLTLLQDPLQERIARGKKKMYNKVVLEKLARYDEFAEYREEC